MNPQFKKGVLPLCVLVLLRRRDRYGYELASSISEKFTIAAGTVYPILRRLTNEGYFETYLQESQKGPPRKYYRLTDTGEQHLHELLAEWRDFKDGVERIIEEGLADDEGPVSE